VTSHCQLLLLHQCTSHHPHTTQCCCFVAVATAQVPPPPGVGGRGVMVRPSLLIRSQICGTAAACDQPPLHFCKHCTTCHHTQQCLHSPARATSCLCGHPCGARCRVMEAGEEQVVALWGLCMETAPENDSQGFLRIDRAINHC